MGDNVGRYLGFAFAGADLLFELNETGKVAFALGAAQNMLGRAEREVVGLAWTDLIDPEDHPLVNALIADLGAGERRGPVRVALRSREGRTLKRFAALSVCKLTEAGPHISCVLGYLTPGLNEAPPAPGPGGLHPVHAFAEFAGRMVAASEQSGRPANVNLIELPGLAKGAKALPAEQGERIISRISATLRSQSVGGQPAGMIAPERFALVADESADMAVLAQRLERIGKQAGLKMASKTAALSLGGMGAGAGVKALTHALERYAVDGADKAGAGFAKALEQTLSDGERFQADVQSGDFALEFQPVVRLASGALHHFEALARFAHGSPDEVIRLAENLDLIQAFDLAVVERVVRQLRETGDGRRIAANISARSLNCPTFIDAVLKSAAGDRTFTGRLMFELTETAAIGDLERANRQIQRLRKAGHTVCLDDFGAGSASLDYLRRLEVDIVKIDGRYVRDLAPGGRDAMLLKHLVALCRDLSIETVAEMVENPHVAAMVRGLGIDMGQGWHYAKPLPTPEWTPQPIYARRVGLQESWG